MTIIRMLAGLAAVVGTTACSQGSLIQQRSQNRAPASATETGVVLEGAKEAEVEALLGRHPGSTVRPLNTQHGMYEMFGITQDEARTQTTATVSQNEFFTVQTQPRSTRWTTLAVNGPVGVKIGNLNPCKNGSASPTAVLQSVSPAKLMDQTIEIGAAVKISGAKSTPGSSGGALKSVLLVTGPSVSSNAETMVEQADFAFTPDALGLYQVFLVVQDASDICSMDALRFLVTANRPYNGPKAPALNIDLKKLSHLGQVSAQQAWQNSEGEGIVIAIIDTGVNYNHPTLASQIELNKKEIPGNGLDDDHNGVADDVIGYDFVNRDEFPYDDDSHGSHVAGLAAGRDFGLARKARILPIKGLTTIGGDVASISAGIRYAVDRGAKIINMSLGAVAPMAHPAMVSAVNYAESKGVLIVAAAGNGDPATGLGFSIDEIPSFPAALPNDNIVSVASFDAENALSSYSNFGKVGVDVVAPGGLAPNDPMISAAYENPKKGLFVGMTGTSMAAPVVSGIAADVWASAPALTALQVKEILMKSGPEVAELKPVTVSGRHLNAASAIEEALQRNVLF